MPYIKTDYRPHYDEILKKIEMIGTKGELEYCVFKLMLKYMSQRPYKYTELHDTTYAVMHCADEFRRRFLDKREDEAMQENGDITV